MTNEEFIESIKLDNEEWKDVVGWKDYYMVSSFGRIISLKRTIRLKNGKNYHVKQKLLKPNKTIHNGIWYNYICLRKECEKFVYAIHRLVAIAFVPNPNNYSEVDHIDRNGLNNSKENLRWCNRLLNMQNPKTREAVLKGQRKRRLRESLVNQ